MFCEKPKSTEAQRRIGSAGRTGSGRRAVRAVPPMPTDRGLAGPDRDGC